MKLHRFLITGMLMLAFVSGSALASDKAAKQAEIRKVAAASLEKFYKAKPELREQVAKAPGYAVFTTLGAGARLVGVNNRDLRTFRVDLAASERVLPLLPAGVKGVAESGIRGPAEVRRLRAAGAANFLVGEALVRAADPAALLRQLAEAG